MKKSVILTILVVYILSIVIVGLIGINLKVYEEIEYTESISCINENYVEFDPEDESDKGYIDQGMNGYIFEFYQENLKVEIRCELLPSSIDVSVLQYEIQSKVATGERRPDGTFLVSFTEPGDARIYVKANDGSNKKIGILILAQNMG